MSGEDALEVIHRAERIVWVAGWRLQERDVLQQLAGTSGLACVRFYPRSDVIQLVTYDGEHLGHIRRDGPHGPGERWLAVLKGQARPAGCYRTALSAAKALARECGKENRESTSG